MVNSPDDITEQIGIIYDQLKDGDINIRQFIQLTKMVYGDHLETDNYARPESNQITIGTREYC